MESTILITLERDGGPSHRNGDLRPSCDEKCCGTVDARKRKKVRKRTKLYF